MTRIYLSPPEVGAEERRMLLEAFDSNWIAPVGPDIDAFERELADRVGVGHAVALSSGTAALHLGLLLVGVGPGDDVLVPSFTFVATAGGRHLSRRPPRVRRLLAGELEHRSGAGGAGVGRPGPNRTGFRPPWSPSTSTVSPPTTTPLTALCDRVRDPVGRGRRRGPGGVLPRPPGRILRPRRGLLLQRQQDHHHQWRGHAGLRLGRAGRPGPLSGHPGPRPLPPLRALRPRVQLPAEQPAGRPGPGPARRPRQPDRAATADQRVLPFGARPACRASSSCRSPTTASRTGGSPASWSIPQQFGADREQIRLALEAVDIESRPTWKPLHLQPVFAGVPTVGGAACAAHLRSRALPPDRIGPVGGSVGTGGRHRPGPRPPALTS